MNAEAADWQAFARLLERTLGRGFRLVVVEAWSPAERAELVAWLAERAPGRRIVEMDSGDSFAENPLGALARAPEADILVLSGFEESERGVDQHEAALQALNVQRDVLVARHPILWVLVLHPSLHAQAVRVAPDFLDFTSLWVAAAPYGTASPSATLALPELAAPTVWAVVPWVGPPSQRALLDAAWEAMGQGRRDAARDLAARVRLAGGELAGEQAALVEGFADLNHEHAARVAERLEGILGLSPALAAVAAVGAAEAWLMAGAPARVEAALARTSTADERWGLSALWIRSKLLEGRGATDDALALIRVRVLPGWRALGGAREVAVAWSGIADILKTRGELDEALRIRREEELPVFERLGDMHSRANTLGRIADILFARGQLDEALRIRREEEIPVYEKLNDIRGRASALARVADILYARGQLDDALRIWREEALPVFDRLGAVRSRANSLGRIADVLLAKGRFDEALSIRLAEQLPVYESLGDVRNRAVTLGKIAEIHHARGQGDRAIKIWEKQVLPVLRKLGERREIAMAESRLADLLVRRAKGSDRRHARQLLEHAATALREMGLPEAKDVARDLERYFGPRP